MKLTEKFIEVMRKCGHIGKDATNEEVGYEYVSAAKINDLVNRALIEVGIASTAESKLIDLREVGGQTLATIEVEITLSDGEETLKLKGIGSGLDGGDKSVAKAQTMAVKYAWRNSLLIADSADDPDAVGGKVKYKASAKSANKFSVPF